METIQHAGKILHTGLPSEPIVDNMVRRVLLLVREAYSECKFNESLKLVTLWWRLERHIRTVMVCERM